MSHNVAAQQLSFYALYLSRAVEIVLLSYRNCEADRRQPCLRSFLLEQWSSYDNKNENSLANSTLPMLPARRHPYWFP